MNFEAYFSFEGVSFNHRIISKKIRLRLRRNMKQTNIYDMTGPRMITVIYVITIR